MIREPVSSRARWPLAPVLAVLLVMCTDGPSPVTPDDDPGPVVEPLPEEPAEGLVTCVGDVTARTVSCGQAGASDGPAAAAVILGGQAEYVGLASTNVSYDGSERFTFDVTLTNLIGQAIGTSDGSTAEGIDVFFHTGPTVTDGTGTITVVGDGTGLFTGSDQPFYHYGEILGEGATSAPRPWRLDMPPSVLQFSFGVYVSAPVRWPTGWIDLAAERTSLDMGDPGLLTSALTATVYDVLGEELPQAPAFSTSDPDVATVDAGTGLVTAAGAGTATITASANGGKQTASLDIFVVQEAGSASLALSSGTLTADGSSTGTATVTVLDDLGNPVSGGGHDVQLALTPINENTPGATLSGVTDHGDGTYTATLTAPVNNGTGTLRVSLDGTPVDSAGVTYSGGNDLPTASAETVLFAEDVGGTFTLSGTDVDGDALTWRLVEIYRRNGYGDTEYTTTAGDTVSPPFVGPNLYDTVDIELDDPELRVIPHTDGSATNFTALTYHVSDGKGASSNVTLQVDVHSVNDAPRVTAVDLLDIWEDESVDFLFQGHDIELDQYRTLIVVPPLARGYLVHHHFTGDITISGQATLQSISDQANDWPSSFTPTQDDHDEVFYNQFGFVFEEINSGLRSEEHTVNVRVFPVNDAPETTLAGIGTVREHDLAATVIDGGTYSIPAVEIDDADQTSSAVPTYSISVETNGGAIALEKANYEDAWVVFTETSTSITWQMEPDVSNQGFVSGLTLDNLLSTLTYTPSGTGADTLIITVGDQGFFGVCEDTKSGTCNEVTTTTITLDVQAGTPPAEVTQMTLTPAGG